MGYLINAIDNIWMLHMILMIQSLPLVYIYRDDISTELLSELGQQNSMEEISHVQPNRYWSKLAVKNCNLALLP